MGGKLTSMLAGAGDNPIYVCRSANGQLLVYLQVSVNGLSRRDCDWMFALSQEAHNAREVLKLYLDERWVNNNRERLIGLSRPQKLL